MNCPRCTEPLVVMSAVSNPTMPPTIHSANVEDVLAVHEWSGKPYPYCTYRAWL